MQRAKKPCAAQNLLENIICLSEIMMGFRKYWWAYIGHMTTEPRWAWIKCDRGGILEDIQFEEFKLKLFCERLKRDDAISPVHSLFWAPSILKCFEIILIELASGISKS